MKYYPGEHVLRDAGFQEQGGRAFSKGAGCSQCHNSGFRGRLGIYEVMEVTVEIRRLIHHAAPAHELRETLRDHGIKTLRQAGVELAMSGASSLEEVLRATHVDEEPAGADHKGSRRVA